MPCVDEDSDEDLGEKKQSLLIKAGELIDELARRIQRNSSLFYDDKTN